MQSITSILCNIGIGLLVLWITAESIRKFYGKLSSAREDPSQDTGKTTDVSTGDIWPLLELMDHHHDH
jgi:hypothetical protein